MVRSIRGISCCLMAVGFGVGLLVHAQPVSRRRFDAASVKRCASNVVAGTSAGVVTVTRVDFTCQTLEFYVRSVYRQSMGKFTGTLRIEGGPPWIRSELYQISAKSDALPTTRRDINEMMKSLLEERFQLKIHTESRAVPAYALVTGRTVLRLPAAKTACYKRSLDQPAPQSEPGQPPIPMCGTGSRSEGGFEVRGSTMADFCLALSNVSLRLDRRKFIDKTGIEGRFDFDLKFPASAGVAVESGGSPVQTDDLSRLQIALSKVGLRLAPAMSTDDVVVIDHADRPTPN